MSKDKNFGLATPRVKLVSELSNIVKTPQKFNFDISAFQWGSIQNSAFQPPLLTENVINPEKAFAFCFPSKRKFFVDNKLAHSESEVKEFPFSTPYDDSTEKKTPLPTGTIFWTPVGPPPPAPPRASKKTSKISSLGIINEILEEQKFPSYWESIDVKDPDARKPLIDRSKIPAKAEKFETYDGPTWVNGTYKNQAQPDDRQIVNNWFKGISGGFPDKVLYPLGPKPKKKDKPTRSSVNQTKVGDGLWWGLESNEFLDRENMPFWVTLELPEDPPDPSKFETLYIVSLGIGSTDNSDRYDLLLSRNRKPTLIDYYGIRGGGDGDAIYREFDVDSSRLGFNKKKIDIGFMTAGGRLIVFVNDTQIVYTRVIKSSAKPDEDDSVGTLKEAKIAKGRIRVYGTNTPVNLYAYPMTFAEKSSMAFPIASEKIVETVEEGPIKTEISYSAADEFGEPTGEPVASWPTPASVVSPFSRVYGVDARIFIDSNDEMALKPSFGLHRKGLVEFFSGKAIPSIPSKPLKTTEFFLLILTPESRVKTKDKDNRWLGADLPYCDPPYFFHLKGVDSAPTVAPKREVHDITDLVINIKESSSAPDYFHITKSASVTIYNEGGELDDLSAGLSEKLINNQYGIEIDWSWNKKSRTKTFTGIVVSQESSEVPGKETLTFQCEDYLHILKHTPIINSPYYDGMIAVHVVKDLAKRGGIQEDAFEVEWEDEEEFFLPAGYSFSKPEMRFDSSSKLFDNIIGIVKRFEAFIYFDGFGKLHIDKLPGGLLGPPKASISPKIRFSSNPDTTDQLILDHKTVTTDFGSTFNQINVMTLDRDTRNLIMISKRAVETDRLTFRKELLIDQPAYGEIAVARDHIEELIKRIFAPILKTSFKTIGKYSVLLPLDFVTVDGVPFRIISISRTFNAENNDYTNEYEAEWLNG